MKPIVGNKVIETIDRSPFKASALMNLFPVASPEELVAMQQPQLESHLTMVRIGSTHLVDHSLRTHTMNFVALLIGAVGLGVQRAAEILGTAE